MMSPLAVAHGLVPREALRGREHRVEQRRAERVPRRVRDVANAGMGGGRIPSEAQDLRVRDREPAADSVCLLDRREPGHRLEGGEERDQEVRPRMRGTAGSITAPFQTVGPMRTAGTWATCCECRQTSATRSCGNAARHRSTIVSSRSRRRPDRDATRPGGVTAEAGAEAARVVPWKPLERFRHHQHEDEAKRDQLPCVGGRHDGVVPHSG